MSGKMLIACDPGFISQQEACRIKTCNSSNRWFGVRHRSLYAVGSLYAVAVGGVLTVSAVAHGGGQPEANLADQINKRLTRGRVVKVEPPLQEAPVIPLNLLETFPNANPDMFETMPVGVPIVTIEIPNDEAIEAGLVDGRGSVATGGPGETYVFYEPHDSGFAWYMKNDDVFGYATWAMQAVLGNGFEPGMAISGYDILMHNSASSINDTSWELSLWDGDPTASVDTTCNGGAPARIPGTTATFTDLPHALDLCPPLFGNADPTCAGLYRLRVTLPQKVVINCDRVWIAATMTAGCRAGWRLAGWCEWDFWCPNIGYSDAVWLLYACEQFGACDTANGYNAGVCGCDDGAPCDHTDGAFECGHPSFCGDGFADYLSIRTGGAPDGYFSYVASVYAPTDIAMEWAPKRATSKSGGGDVPSEVIGNEIILYQGGVNIMLELQVNDWSGDDGLTRLRGFGAALDTNGYSNGLGGALTEKLIPCTSTEECVAAFGGSCSILGNACRQADDCSLFPFETCEGSTCLPYPSRLEGYCAPGYAATRRPDFCLVHTDPFYAVDVSWPAYRFGSAGFDQAGRAFGDLDLTAKDGKAYMGTLWLEAPANAKGSYTVGLYPFPDTVLVDQNAQKLPLVRQIPAKITVLDCKGTDCQPNGIPDDCEIQRGLTEDCNGNAIPDDCDIGTGATTDCNENRIPDECDIADGTSQDCNGNDVPDDCEPDCNGNGAADSCDIHDGISSDCNGNEVPDECLEVESDCNENLVPDGCDIDEGTSADTDGNRVPDECQMLLHVPSEDYPTIQSAINAAVNGALVVVADGIYTGPGNKNLTLFGKLITVQCPNGPEACTIDCENVGRGFILDNFETAETVIDGFAITRCRAESGAGIQIRFANPTIRNCVFTDNVAEIGGAMYIWGDATVSNCEFTGNVADAEYDAQGGAVYIRGSNPTISSCTFLQNQVTGDSSVYGGAIYLRDSSPTLTECTFVANSGSWGGAIYGTNSSPALENCTFEGNIGTYGAGLHNHDGSNPTLSRCTFTANISSWQGGAMRNSFSSRPQMTGCIFRGNTAAREGGAIMNRNNARSTVLNSTFVHNVAGEGAAVYNHSDSSAIISSCIIWDNSADAITGPGIAYVSYSDVQGGHAGAGNIDADPRFADGDNGDYHLLADSPCINAGNPHFAGDPGEVDLDGQPRVQHCRVDMGVDETALFIDCNTNGQPDACEILDGAAEDCNTNFVPDACESTAEDCNGNGVWDPCDVDGGTSVDCNDDRVPDECQLPDEDCNRNGTLDECDIDDGRSEDCNSNQLPDECDIETGVSWDCDGSGVPDECEAIYKVYWTELYSGKIHRADTDGSNVRILVTGLIEVIGIALDLAGGKMYWTDGGPWGSPPATIQRANLDGSAIEDLVTAGLAGPHGIALDLAAGKMYWADFVAGKIQRANLDGSAVEDLITGLVSPWDIALDLAAGRMYWSESTSFWTGKIRRANLDGSGVEDVVGGLIDPRHMALDLTRGKVYWTDRGADLIQRANLDGSEVEVLLRGLSNRLGIAIDPRGGRMYWVDMFDDVIRCAKLDGSDIRTVLRDLSQPIGIALELTLPPDCQSNGTPDACDINDGLSEDCNKNGMPDECEPDCNNNNTADSCDITAGTSEDCGGDGVPDECQLEGNDCNENGRPDECDILPDCNDNGIPDECDFDCQPNGVPDDCECVPTDPPQPEQPVVAKNRYLSLEPGNAGCHSALRVTFVDLPQPFNAWNGMKLYVGEPERICENSGQITPLEPDNPPDYGCGVAPGLDPPWFWAAPLMCDPNRAHFDDWSAYGVVHVYHEGIVPSGVYNIRAIDDGCSLEEDANYSEPLTMTQTRWADVCGPGPGGACSAVADGLVDMTNDVLGLLDKFANVNNLQKARADLEPGDDGANNGPDFKVNVANDVLYCLDAFTGAPYPFVPGEPCGPG